MPPESRVSRGSRDQDHAGQTVRSESKGVVERAYQFLETLFLPARAFPRDYYVRIGSCRYSEHSHAIRRSVDITSDMEIVTMSLHGRCLGTHIQFWGAGLMITDPDHGEAARTRRKAFQSQAPGADTTGLRDPADDYGAFGVVLDDGQVA